MSARTLVLAVWLVVQHRMTECRDEEEEEEEEEEEFIFHKQ